MKVEIKSWYSGSVLFSLETKSLKLCVEAAVKSRADLSRANLSGANLYGANLSGAKGINACRCTPLMLLLDQPNKIRAYKLVNQDSEGPMRGGIKYEMGKTYKVDNANCDITEQCGAGINLATLDWCIREWCEGYRILIAEFTAKDIAAIPTATDGKFRVHRCKIVGEKDLAEIGLIEKKEALPTPRAGTQEVTK